MADERIEDITGGELTAFALDDKFVILDKSDTTDDASGTVKYIEAATMGMLTTKVSSADADVTGAVGQLDCVDISGYTADKDYILPTTAAVGDRAGICITTGDDAYELDLHTVNASSDTINGVNSSVGTASWSRLFITGEVVIFRCVVANTAWIVEYDGRIPCKASLHDTAGQSILTGTTTAITHDTINYDVGDIATANSATPITLRRNGKVVLSGYVRTGGWLDDAKQIITGFDIDSAGSLQPYTVNQSAGVNAAIAVVAVETLTLTNTDTISHMVLHNQGTTEALLNTAANYPRLCVHEVF